MPFSPNDQLGPYTLISLIGAGGMGEVWKARDTRLNRLVAIKTSKKQFDERFAQEAHAIAALNHPNICSLYDVGPDYLVMEYVEGRSVRHIEELHKLLDVATQIADGLQAAHAAGFLHRDLKPDNILITKEGRVKILDFGVAKSIAPPKDSEATLVKSITGKGVVVGTPAYMSPEQVRGEAGLDPRSDQFSFGLVLYELASGIRAFDRPTSAETMAAIIRDDPEPPPATLPQPLRWTIERCLSKDRERRYHSTRDLYEELRLMSNRLTSITAPVIKPIGSRGILKLLWAIPALAAGFLFAALLPMSSGGPGRAVPFASEAEIQTMPAWSPDGKRIAYAADVNGVFQIFTKQLNSAASTQITKQDSPCSSPFWSPDGLRIYYIVGQRSLSDTSLWSISLSGGQAEMVLDGISEAAISPNGKTLAVLQKEAMGLYRLAFSSPPGDPPRLHSGDAVSDLPVIRTDSYLRFTRDGKYLGFYTDAGGRVSFWKIPMTNTQPETGGQAEEISKGNHQARTAPFDWLPDNLGIISRFNSLGGEKSLGVWDFQQRVQRPITAATAKEVSPSLSPDGRILAYATGSHGYDVIEVPLDGSASRNVIATARSEVAPSVAPNGFQFAYISDRGGADELWLRNRHDGSDRLIVGGEPHRSDSPDLLDTAISPDGSRVAYRKISRGEIEIWIAPLSGEAPVRMWQDPAKTPQRGPTWSPDGNWLAYYSSRGGKGAVLKARVGANTQPELVAYVDQTRPAYWSPRGDWIAFDDTAGLRLVNPDNKRDVVISSRRCLIYGWSNDGASLYGIAPIENHHLMLVRMDVPSMRETKLADMGLASAAMTFAGFEGHSSYRGFSMNPDGKSFLTSVYRAKMDIWLLKDFNKRTRLLDRFWPRQ